MTPVSNKSTVKNASTVLVIIVILFSLLAGRIFYFQTFEYSAFQDKVLSQLTTETTVKATRGKIMDKNGVVLATNITVYRVFIEPKTIAKLAAHPNIIAMKDSSSVIALFNKFRVALEPFAEKFSLFMGPDEAMGEAVLLGADGGVCTGANLWPRAFKEMYLAAKAGDIEKVRALQRFTTMSSYLLYGLGQGQIGFLKSVKCALAEMGLIQNVLASPFSPFTGRERAKVKAALKRLKSVKGE